MSQPVNKALLEVATAVGLTPEQVDDCAERWKAVYGVNMRDPLPEEMSHLESDALRLMALRRILEGYKRGL